MIVLGIHSFTHDSSAALAVDGRLAAFGEEERFSRRKGDPRFPQDSILHCLADAGVRPGLVDCVVVPFRPGRGAFRRLAYLARRPASFPARAKDLIAKGLRMKQVRTRLARLGIESPITYEDHYLCHARSVFLSSTFEEAAVVVLDGVAEDASGALFHARRFPTPSFQCVRRFPFPKYSLGLLYAAITEHVGFRHNREEGKVMAMAALGKADLLPELETIVSIPFDGRFLIPAAFDFGGEWTTRRFHRVFGKPRPPDATFLQAHFDLARAVQSLCERVAIQVSRDLLRTTGTGNLCFTGGLALNPALNGALLRESGCKRFHAIPPGGDAGTAIGAALSVQPDPRWSLSHAFWGRPLPESRIQAEIRDAGLHISARGENAVKTAAALLANGRIGGWFQQRAEMGPRALGHRSILADPRSAEVRHRLNRQVKRRHDFQPFGAVVIPEQCSDLFRGLSVSPFMLLTFPASEMAVERIPAVIHVDRTSRIQTVEEGDPSTLYPLLSEFQRLTGLAVLLNTSLNMKGEPLADTAAEALRVFELGRLDFIVLNDCLITREEAGR